MCVSTVSTVSNVMLTRSMILLSYSVLLTASALFFLDDLQDLLVAQTSRTKRPDVDHRIAPQPARMARAASKP